MNVFELLKSLAARASHLEDEAKALRIDAHQIQTLLFGIVDDASEAPSKGSSSAGKKKDPTASKMPNRDEIRSKAAQYGVDVDDILPVGKKPTLQAKQDAMKRIVKVKRLAEEAASKSQVDLSNVS